MRILIVPILSLLAASAQADTVAGYCERDGKRLAFTDGIAFEDARDADGTLTTTVYLSANRLDRAALATCGECREALGENTFVSPRGDVVELQHAALDAGWLEFQHVGGEMDMTTLVNLMYKAPDGTLTGLDGGNGRIELTTRDGARIAGKVLTEAREAPFNETDMQCDIRFDLAVGWPGTAP